MNFLGHLYLSSKNPHFLIGGFMADQIKGKKYLSYPSEIQKGILYHRKTDTKTDSDKSLLSLKKHLYPHVHKYAGVVIDIYLDHILAKHWKCFSDIPLNVFARNTCFILVKNQHYLPLISKYILLRMILGSWLTGYSTFKGFSSALKGMGIRRVPGTDLMSALIPIKQNETIFENTCLAFLKQVTENKDSLTFL